MCSNVGNRDWVERPNREELGAMGCDADVCGVCRHYGWSQMLGEWLPYKGRCVVNIKGGVVRADTQGCRYFCKGEKV